jgi:hypothetical protein
MALRKERKLIQAAWNGLNGSRSNIQFKSKRSTEWVSYIVSGLLGNGDITIIELNLKTMAKRKLPEMSFDIESSAPSYELMMSPKGWEKFNNILMKGVKFATKFPSQEMSTTRFNKI